MLCLGGGDFVSTTDSDHDLRVGLNLAALLELIGIDQLWVADITFIRLADDFVYLALLGLSEREIVPAINHELG